MAVYALAAPVAGSVAAGHVASRVVAEATNRFADCIEIVTGSPHSADQNHAKEEHFLEHHAQGYLHHA